MDTDVPLYFYRQWSLLAEVNPFLTGGIGILAIIVLLFFSALMSGSEIAFFSISENDKKKLNEENSSVSRQILSLLKKPRTLLATILISNNFVNIAIVLVAQIVIQIYLPEQVKSNPILDFLITVVGITFLLVLFGEIAPKVYANQFNIRLSKMMAGPISTLKNIFYLPTTGLVVSSLFLEKLLVRRNNIGKSTSRKEIDRAIDLTVKNETGANEEANILKSIIKFGEVAVKQIMQPRIDIIAIEKNMSYSQVLAVVKESGYSRLPVYEGDLDHIVGILYVKDLIGHLNQDYDFEWQTLVREAILFVPEAKKIDDLLNDIQIQRKHMAIVVDEYGGTLGLVTLEDILEEIVGDIKDEFDDDPEVDYRKIDEWNYEFEAKTLINDFCRVMNIDSSTFDQVRGDADSLAGLVLEITGHFPVKNQKIVCLPYTFTITGVSKRRIEHILVTLPKHE